MNVLCHGLLIHRLMSKVIKTVVSTTLKMAELDAIPENIKIVKEKIAAACALRTPEIAEICESPRLVAVGKLKSVDHLVKAYEGGIRHFGENYVQELVDKATGPETASCPDMKFHFIGHLQRNKISKLLSAADKLYMIETIDSETLAKSINDALERKQLTSAPLNVMVLINTSGEEAKSGAEPEAGISLAKYIMEECKNLHFKGLMTIGALERSVSCDDVNIDFRTLFNLREKLCKDLSLDRKNVELSMGMSADYENAIVQGSTNVRVGSFIFGTRPPKQKPAEN